MVQCAAINCNNSSNRGQKISLFAFPRDRKLHNIWVTKLKRGNFSPSYHSRLYERHFEEDCFTQDRRLLESIGFTPGRKLLKPGAIPTIFDYSVANIRKSTPGRSVDSCLVNAHLSTQNKNRSSTAVKKRRCLEVLMETQTSALDLTKTADKCVGPNDPLETYNVGCQTSYNLTKRHHVSLQTRISEMKPSVMSCRVQTTTASAQCHRYNHTQTKHTKSESDDESDMDISPPDQGHDSKWSPSEEDFSDLEDDVTPFYKFDSNETDPDKAHKYVVFEQSLFELLDICPVCRRRNLQHIKTTVGTCVCITSRCACGFLRKWRSQPFSNSMPWGNLVIACGIFFSGNSPVETFNCMSQSGILGLSLTLTAYNKLQRSYIVPTTLSCWQ